MRRSSKSLKSAIILTALLSSTQLPATAWAEGMQARETAYALGKGGGELGVFNPMQWGLNDKVTLETHPLLFLMGNFTLTARVQHLEVAGFTLSGEYGLGLPTLAMRLSTKLGFASPFFPTWDSSDKKIGWYLVPHVGVLASRRFGEGGVLTLRLDGSLGLKLGKSDALPIDSVFAPLELVMAPMLTGFRLRAGGGYDHPLTEWLRLRGQLNLYLTGAHPEGYAALSPFIFELYAGADLRLSKRSRITLGVKMYNWDQHATKLKSIGEGMVRREAVRSTDFWPTLDYLFRW